MVQTIDVEADRSGREDAPSYPRFLPPEPGDEAWAREAFRADGALGRQDETEPRNGMNQDLRSALSPKEAKT